MSGYSDEEYVSLFNSIFDIGVTLQDMKSIKSDFVQKIYYRFLKDLQANLDNINMLPFDVKDTVSQQPELYREAARIMTLAKIIRYFFITIDKDDTFMPADLFDPKPKRTRRYFSLLVDFYIRANDFTEAFSDIEEKLKLQKQGKRKLLENIDVLKTKLGELRQQNTKYKIQEDEMIKRISAEQTELSGASAVKKNLQLKMEELKMEKSINTNDINDAKLQILEAKEFKENLCQQVVQDSEKFDIEERENQLSKNRDNNRQKVGSLDELKKSMKTINIANTLMKDNLLCILVEIQEAKNKESEYENFRSQMEKEKSVNLEEVEDIHMKMQQFQEQLVSRQERISQINMAWNVKKESLQEEINQNRLTLKEIKRNKSEDEIAAQDLETERMQIEKEIVSTQQQISNFDKFVFNKYQSVMQAMETQQTNMEDVLTDLTNTVNKAKGI